MECIFDLVLVGIPSDLIYCPWGFFTQRTKSVKRGESYLSMVSYFQIEFLQKDHLDMVPYFQIYLVLGQLLPHKYFL